MPDLESKPRNYRGRPREEEGVNNAPARARTSNLEENRVTKIAHREPQYSVCRIVKVTSGAVIGPARALGRVCKEELPKCGGWRQGHTAFGRLGSRVAGTNPQPEDFLHDLHHLQ